MPASVVMWIAAAVSVFWALGAYNRLVLQRAKLTRSLHALASHWNSAAQSLRDTLQESAVEPASQSQWGSLGDDSDPWHLLSLAAKQMQACMAGVLARPDALPPVDDLASLRAARAVLDSAWKRLQDSQEDLAGAVVPQQLLGFWQHHTIQSDEKLMAYNTQAGIYNQAIAQFPALLLAWVFDFSSTVNL